MKWKKWIFLTILVLGIVTKSTIRRNNGGKLGGWRAKIEAVEQRNGRNRKWRLFAHNDAFNLVSEDGASEDKLLNRNNLRGKGQYTF